MKKIKIPKMVSNGLYILVITLLISMTAIVLYNKASGGEPELFGYQFKTVLSGSMEPTFKTGSIIAVKQVADATKLKKNDVITFADGPRRIVTHRITKVIEQDGQIMYQTKGDNNKHADANAVLPKNIIAVYSGITIPFIGYLLNFTASPMGVALLLVLPGIVLIGYSVFTIRQALKEIERRTTAIPQENTIEKTL